MHSSREGKSESSHPTESVVEKSPHGRYVKHDTLIRSNDIHSIWKCMDTEEGMEVAWHVVDLTKLNDLQQERICAEVSALQDVNSEHILKCFRSWIDEEENKLIFITHTFVDNNLRRFVSRSSKEKTNMLKPKVLRKWCRQILSVIGEFHAVGVRHGGLSWNTVFVNETTGDIRIGLGMITTPAGDYTPDFTAPEVLLDPQHAHMSCDTYSFGMCILAVLAKKLPFSNDGDEDEVEQEILSRIESNALSDLKQAKTMKLYDMIHHATTLQEDGNYPSCETMLQDPWICPESGGSVSPPPVSNDGNDGVNSPMRPTRIRSNTVSAITTSSKDLIDDSSSSSTTSIHRNPAFTALPANLADTLTPTANAPIMPTSDRPKPEKLVKPEKLTKPTKPDRKRPSSEKQATEKGTKIRNKKNLPVTPNPKVAENTRKLKTTTTAKKNTKSHHTPEKTNKPQRTVPSSVPSSSSPSTPCPVPPLKESPTNEKGEQQNRNNNEHIVDSSSGETEGISPAATTTSVPPNLDDSIRVHHESPRRTKTDTTQQHTEKAHHLRHHHSSKSNHGHSNNKNTQSVGNSSSSKKHRSSVPQSPRLPNSRRDSLHRAMSPPLPAMFPSSSNAFNSTEREREKMEREKLLSLGVTNDTSTNNADGTSTADESQQSFVRRKGMELTLTLQIIGENGLGEEIEFPFDLIRDTPSGIAQELIDNGLASPSLRADLEEEITAMLCEATGLCDQRLMEARCPNNDMSMNMNMIDPMMLTPETPFSVFSDDVITQDKTPSAQTSPNHTSVNGTSQMEGQFPPPPPPVSMGSATEFETLKSRIFANTPQTAPLVASGQNANLSGNFSSVHGFDHSGTNSVASAAATIGITGSLASSISSEFMSVDDSMLMSGASSAQVQVGDKETSPKYISATGLNTSPVLSSLSSNINVPMLDIGKNNDITKPDHSNLASGSNKNCNPTPLSNSPPATNGNNPSTVPSTSTTTTVTSVVTPASVPTTVVPNNGVPATGGPSLRLRARQKVMGSQHQQSQQSIQ
eukprot:TRINITY_DN2097_c0_g1_i1.p1 TRINITY_DN2097_c0_g1~~TRINITY_DN2097_c0_g1_i1.p1  ORF type:complete len:1030 (-),score=335.95 TRINITY_DN2097_c0_g1_i1:208-3297(-)